jgi:hypothetical protein
MLQRKPNQFLHFLGCQKLIENYALCLYDLRRIQQRNVGVVCLPRRRIRTGIALGGCGPEGSSAGFDGGCGALDGWGLPGGCGPGGGTDFIVMEDPSAVLPDTPLRERICSTMLLPSTVNARWATVSPTERAIAADTALWI